MRALIKASKLECFLDNKILMDTKHNHEIHNVRIRKGSLQRTVSSNMYCLHPKIWKLRSPFH